MRTRQILSENATKENFLKAVAEKLQQLFRPKSIFRNSYLRARMEEDYKCYLEYSEILSHTDIRPFIQEVSPQYENLNSQKQLSACMMEAVRMHSKHLWANFKGIRPIKPYSLKELTPLYFTDFDTSDNCQHFQTLLQGLTAIMDVSYTQDKQTAIVYAQNPEILLELDGYEWHQRQYEDRCSVSLDYRQYGGVEEQSKMIQNSRRFIRVNREQNYVRPNALFSRMAAKDRFDHIYQSSIDKFHPCVVSVQITKKPKENTLFASQEHGQTFEHKIVGNVDFSQTDRTYRHVQEEQGLFKVLLSKSKYERYEPGEGSSEEREGW